MFVPSKKVKIGILLIVVLISMLFVSSGVGMFGYPASCISMLNYSIDQILMRPQPNVSCNYGEIPEPSKPNPDLGVEPINTLKNGLTDLGKLCGLNVLLKDGMEVEQKPLLNQSEAERLLNVTKVDGSAYYNENEDVFEVNYPEGKNDRSTFLTIVCENRSNGKVYSAEGNSVSVETKDYAIDEVVQKIDWSLFKDIEFRKNTKNFHCLIGNSNSLFISFEYKNKKYRISGEINKTEYRKYAASDIEMTLAKQAQISSIERKDLYRQNDCFVMVEIGIEQRDYADDGCKTVKIQNSDIDGIYEWANEAQGDQNAIYSNWMSMHATQTSDLHPNYGIRSVSTEEKKCQGFLKYEGGMQSKGQCLIIGRYSETEQIIDAKDKFLKQFAPVDNESEAQAFVNNFEPDISRNKCFDCPECDCMPTERDVKVLALPDYYLVQLTKKNTYGCGLHRPTKVIYKVQKDGFYKLIAREQFLKSDVDESQPNPCID
jgi:hypothetical protein